MSREEREQGKFKQDREPVFQSASHCQCTAQIPWWGRNKLCMQNADSAACEKLNGAVGSTWTSLCMHDGMHADEQSSCCFTADAEMHRRSGCRIWAVRQVTCRLFKQG